MAREIPLALQTAYADLVDRAISDAFAEDFRQNGTYVCKKRKDRRYWYFQLNDVEGRPQKYVGPETPALLQLIKQHQNIQSDLRHRRTIVSSLVNSAGLPRPPSEIGDILHALERAGVFRLRAVLVGTVAYQTYAAALGVRLPSDAILTFDVDIAQFHDIALAVKDTIPPLLDTLRSVDSSFRPIPHMGDSRHSTRYETAKGLRVDFLTPNTGPDSEEPMHLEALQTDAEPLRFLDFLIANPMRAVALHGAGIPVLVPTPERFAVHKLIVAGRRRREDQNKIEKDRQQAAYLLHILAERRTESLRDAWDEAWARGPTWRTLLGAGLGKLHFEVRDATLKAIGASRSLIPGLTLTFAERQARYDLERDVVAFGGEAGNERVVCWISLEALSDDFSADRYNGQASQRSLAAFSQDRATIESLARWKFEIEPIEKPNFVLIRPGDLQKFRRTSVAS